MKTIKSIILSSILLISLVPSTKVLAQTKQDIDAHKRRWDTPAWTDTVHNPFKGNAAITDTGKFYYNKLCFVCHGNSGKGDGVAAPGLSIKPADHTSMVVQSQTDGSLYYELTNGHAPMPAYKTIMTNKQRWALINYIRVLGLKSKPAKK